MRGRKHDCGKQTNRFEHLEARQLLSVSPLAQDDAQASFVGPILPDAPAQASEGLPVFAAGLASDSGPVAQPATGSPFVTVDPFVVVSQGFANLNGTNPSPQDGRYFRGFPTMEVLPSGRIITVFNANTSHGGPDAQARWTYSDDQGATWSTPTIMSIEYNGSQITSISPESIWRVPSGPYAGRLLLSFWNVADPAKSRIAWSDDQGQTWSASVPASDTNPTFSTYHFGGHPIQLADGSLLSSGYAHVTGQLYYVATTMRSTDGGQTWAPWSTIASGQGVGSGEQPEEPVLLLMDNGQILATVREDTSASIRTYISTDGTGSSWTLVAGAPFGAFRGFGRPSLVQDEYGTIICMTRDAFTTYPIFFVSRDHGATWSPSQPLGPDARYFAYGDMRAVGNGKIATVYGVQSTNTNVRADVRFTYLTDHLTGNPPPVLDMIGDRTVDTNTNLSFVAHATNPNGAGVVYSLGPGAPSGATINPTTGAFNWLTTGSIGTKYALTVIATQVGSPQLWDYEPLVITIVAPAPVASVTGPSTALGGEVQTFTVSAVDSSADMAAGFSFQIDWGDGSAVQTVTGGIQQNVTHAFVASGLLTVSVTAFDQSGHGSLVATSAILVEAAQLRPNVDNPLLTDLVWAGTPGNDHLELQQIGDGTTIRIRELMLNGVAVSHTQDFEGVTGRVIATGYSGDDVLDARGMQTRSVTLNGNGGNNTLYGGNGGDILIGGSNGGEGRQGNNVIIAGDGTNTIYGNDLAARKKSSGGNNLIVGGNGQDTIYGNFATNLSGNGGEGGKNLIVGGGGADVIYASQIVDGAEGGHGSILVAGETELDQSALLLVLGEWTSSRTFAERVANIQGTGSGDRLNENNFLQAGATVSPDGSIDDLYSDTNGATNWLLDSVGHDLVHRLKSGDIETNTP